MLDQITLEMLTSLNSIESEKNRLIDITSDVVSGIIDQKKLEQYKDK